MASTGMYRDDRGRKVLDTEGYEAIMKGLGFQPNSVARVQDATMQVQQMIAQNKVREAEIADQWAKGLFEGDQEAVDKARAALARWNRDNPSSPIKIDRQQVRRRVAQMRASKEERMAKTAPKEIRAEVKRELEAAR
jgi:ABC-type nitrate/sulfonate/bicarbonate transport system substrate-binding protein